MFSGIDDIYDKNGEVHSNRPPLISETNEMMTRIQDMEYRIPKGKELNSNDAPMDMLPDDALLVDVIKAINQLIKRDFTVKEVK